MNKPVVVILMVVVLLLALAGMSVWSSGADNAVSVTAGRTLDGDDRFHADPTGNTRFRVAGHGKTVILIHAFNGYLETWNPNVAPLVETGFKVVRYDLWGRGLSDRPAIDYTLADFRAQLRAMIASSGSGPVHLVGASFGSVIAADYALHYPDQVDKLVFLGPAGWPGEHGGEAAFLRLPWLPDLVFGFLGKQILRPTVAAYLHDPVAHQWALERWAEFASLPGVGRVALATMRNSPVRDFTEGWAAFGKLRKPNIFIWGKQDVSFPVGNAIRARQLVPNTRIVEIDGAAHWVNVEKPNAVNAAIVDFLRS